MLTADTITDEQIRELRDYSRRRDVRDFDTLTTCLIALAEPIKLDAPRHYYSDDYRRRCRARCAEILNERTKEAR